jgi:diphthamide synthase (EF-2-diphthine--ammonia ligase)
VVTCVDNKVLSVDFAGREFDGSFIDSLPEGVDPCGENGEFHTFAYEAPVCSRPVPYKLMRTFDDGAFSYAIIGPATPELDHGEQ